MKGLFILVLVALLCIFNVFVNGLSYEANYSYKGLHYKWEGTLELVQDGEVIAFSDGCSQVLVKTYDLYDMYLEYNITVSCERKNRPMFDISLTASDPGFGKVLFNEQFRNIPLLFSAKCYRGYFNMLDNKGNNDKNLRLETVPTEYNYLNCS